MHKIIGICPLETILTIYFRFVSTSCYVNIVVKCVRCIMNVRKHPPLVLYHSPSASPSERKVKPNGTLRVRHLILLVKII